MKIEDFGKSEKLHHAYLVVGDRDENLKLVKKELEQKVGKLAGYPDFHEYSEKTFGIDEARYFKRVQSQKSLGKQFFLINSVTVTREAQNALLKVFEEPTRDTHFFVLAGSEDSVIPTLKSRALVLHGEKEGGNLMELGENFIKLDVVSRLKYIKPIIEEKDNKVALDLVNGIEVALYNRLKKNPREIPGISLGLTLGNLQEARMRIERNPAQLKMHLENLILTL